MAYTTFCARASILPTSPAITATASVMAFLSFSRDVTLAEDIVEDTDGFGVVAGVEGVVAGLGEVEEGAGFGVVEAAGFGVVAAVGVDVTLGVAAEDFGAEAVVFADSGFFSAEVSVSISDEVTGAGGKIFSSVSALLPPLFSVVAAEDTSDVSIGSDELFTGFPTGLETLSVSLSVASPAFLPLSTNTVAAAPTTTTVAAAIIGTSFFDFLCEAGISAMFLGALQFLQNCSSSYIS